MKLFRLFFFALIAFLGLTRGLTAAAENDKSHNTQYFSFYWTGNEKNLHLNFDILNSNLKIPNSYVPYSLEDGKGCEFICKPIRKTIFSPEGSELFAAKVNVEVQNIKEGSNGFIYLISVNCSYGIIEGDEFNDKSLVNCNSEYNVRGALDAPHINLSQESELSKVKGKPQAGIVAFKFLLPGKPN